MIIYIRDGGQSVAFAVAGVPVRVKEVREIRAKAGSAYQEPSFLVTLVDLADFDTVQLFVRESEGAGRLRAGEDVKVSLRFMEDNGRLRGRLQEVAPVK